MSSPDWRPAGTIWPPDLSLFLAGHKSRWRLLAACDGADLDVFFDPETEDQALEFCMRCSVRRECLLDELDATGGKQSNQYGVRGGMTADERRDLIKWQRDHDLDRHHLPDDLEEIA